MATAPQLRKIWGSARELGLGEEELRDVVERVTAQRSISALTCAQARDVIDQLVRLGATPGAQADQPRKPSGRRRPEGVAALITPDQRALIEDLRAQLGGNWTRDSYFEGACKRLLRRPRPASSGDAARVIEMLKRRLEHDARKRSEKA